MAATATVDTKDKEIQSLRTQNKELLEQNKKNAEGLETLTKNMNGLIETLSKTRQADHPDPKGIFNIRKGEDIMSSRGFSFMKMLGVVGGVVDPENAKIELEVHNRLHKAYVKGMGNGNNYDYGGRGLDGRQRVLAPLGVNYMYDVDNVIDRNFRSEIKSLTDRGVEGTDIDQMAWVKRKAIERYGSKALSWLQEGLGGSLVAPPEMGELIELLRNKEALVNAGARTVPLPPQGRLTYPRQTAASLTYWVGENAPITESTIGTGTVTMQAKKLAVLIKTPNELIRFASPAAEALIRDDMTKSLALGLDLACLEGNGGDTRPRGVINFPNINTVTSSKPGVNGDSLYGPDIYRMIAAVEESNAEFEGWIMRPKTLYKYYQLRNDAVSQGDSQGPFLFNLIREAGDGVDAMLGGFPVTKSTQVSQVQTKGTSNNLTYILGGMWSDALIGMFGAIEFAATTMGDTSFTNDQTWLKGIISCDFTLRHEAAFVYSPNYNVLGS